MNVEIILKTMHVLQSYLINSIYHDASCFLINNNNENVVKHKFVNSCVN